jgi:hypothetical protein
MGFVGSRSPIALRGAWTTARRAAAARGLREGAVARHALLRDRTGMLATGYFFRVEGETALVLEAPAP